MNLLMIVPFLLLVSCDREQASFYKAAKDNPDSEVCYNVTRPEHLVGRYCLYYKGKAK